MQAIRFAGCEFATFRSAPGVSDAQLLAASQRMREEFLQHEAGFVEHALLKGDDGLWADMVLAESHECARRICERFMQHEACLAYLALMAADSARLGFWQRLSLPA